MNQSAVMSNKDKVLASFFDCVNATLDRIEKNRIRLDEVCDRINFSDYYKNAPQEVGNKCATDRPDSSDAAFVMEKLLQRLEREDYKLNQASEFISNFI